MKKFLITLFLIVAVFLPFGGKVVSTFIPGVVCPGEGPIIITPAGLSSLGLYAMEPATKRYLYGTVLPGSWILGLYELIPLPICWEVVPPYLPVPVFPIIMFGSSLPSF